MRDYNKYIGLEHNRHTFNCWHFVIKVMTEMFNIDLPDTPDAKSLKPLGTKRGKDDAPEEGDIVLMYDPVTHEPDHVGVYIGRNRVIHNHGPVNGSVNSHLRACTRAFWKVEVYALNNST